MYEMWGRCCSFMILPCISCTPYYKHGYHLPHLWSRYITVLSYISDIPAGVVKRLPPIYSLCYLLIILYFYSCTRSIARCTLVDSLYTAFTV